MSTDLRTRLVEALREVEPQKMTVPGARAAAVLIPIYPAPEATLVFTVRSDTLGSHAGQISFPGGRVDPGESIAEAAVRETNEEIDLATDEVELVGELDTFPTFVSGYVVTPLVGWIPREPALKRNPAEVASILHVPLRELSEEIRHEPGFTHSGRRYPTEAWVWRDHVIWGVTARIVRQLLVVLAKGGLCDPPKDDEGWWANHMPPPQWRR